MITTCENIVRNLTAIKCGWLLLMVLSGKLPSQLPTFELDAFSPISYIFAAKTIKYRRQERLILTCDAPEADYSLELWPFHVLIANCTVSFCIRLNRHQSAQSTLAPYPEDPPSLHQRRFLHFQEYEAFPQMQGGLCRQRQVYPDSNEHSALRKTK